MCSFTTYHWAAMGLGRQFDHNAGMAAEKLSTAWVIQVGQRELQGRFMQQLQIMMRANMDGLKKRVRAKVKGKA
jgi:hypothetical protein